MRLLIVQYGGDYRKVFEQVRNQGIETYHAQKYVVETVTELSQKLEEVALLCCQTQQTYNEEVQPGLRVIGAGVEPYQNSQRVLEIIQAQQPTHLVIHFPHEKMFRWGIQQQVKILGLFADSFLQRGWKRRLKNYTLARLLNHPQVDLVANHGINACLSLQQIGVNPNKIIPWDFPHHRTPHMFPTKELKELSELSINSRPLQLVYVGLIQENKGVGDILTAVAKLGQFRPLSVKIAGGGEIEKFQRRAQALKISEQVEFLGLIPQTRVIELMSTADAVIVPSWHEYPEGLPLTIYEALSTRTPIIASDHPMFRGNLIHRQNAMIFPERNPQQLAACIRELFTNPQLYAQISLATASAWENLQIPLKWGDLIQNWLFGVREDQTWFRDRLR